ncbi:hypothetical protein ACIP98_41905 [Streptomyces sp. NPDC088354]|uniref:hypothetical protein n=1 Tax=Streptomyces sp. NPDC088354 TaxID=3365856 RepID=UPI00380D48BE
MAEEGFGRARYTFRLRVSYSARAGLEAEWVRCRWVCNECVDRTRIAGEAAAITRKGKTVAYLVPAEWFEEQEQRAAQQQVSDASRDAA